MTGAHALYGEEFRIFTLLQAVSDPGVLQEYYGKTVRPLEDYDRENRSDLTSVLRSYLQHNGSVKETADELYLHRNTVNYKIKKIESLLNMDLSSLGCRFSLQMGLMVEDFMAGTAGRHSLSA